MTFQEDKPMTFSQLGAHLLSRFTETPAELRQRIDDGIRTHRMGDCTVRVADAAGAPIVGAQVEIRQIRHEFHFGANTFLLDGYDTPAANRRWEEAFVRLFNLGAVGFYWGDYEPQPGHLRFDAGSEPRYRRPPVDRALTFCEDRGITPKGHNLYWDYLLPDWLPDDPEQHWPYIERRFEQIAARYGDRIRSWDVVNEALDRRPIHRVPRRCLARCWELAGQLFPPQARLFVNETTGRTWRDFHRDSSACYIMIDWLLRRGARVGGIGMQFHLFDLLHDLRDSINDLLSPAHLLDVLDTYADFGLPIHISEVTVPAAGDLPDGEEVQAELVRWFYKTWFSHPAVEAIVWWNLADGHAHKQEGRFRGGLLDESLAPKPAYQALDALINGEWQTRLTAITDGAGELRFRGFYGDYEVAVAGKPPQRAHLARGGSEVMLVSAA